MSFTPKQIKELEKPLLAENVSSREGTGNTKLSYITSHHAINEANRIFDFDGWTTEILSLNQVDKTHYIKPKYNSNDAEKQMVSISYLCKLRVTVKTNDGEVVKEDVGVGNGVMGDSAYGITNCIELAAKESVSDALKRCLRYFGNQFGNSLYNKDAEAPIGADAYEANRPITEDELKSLRNLADAREVNDEWMLAWLSGEGWTEPLDSLRHDWYLSIYNAVDIIGKDDRDKESYESDIENVIKLMNESVNLNMLKAIFTEAWNKTKKQDDKERQRDIQKTYEELKEKFEDKK